MIRPNWDQIVEEMSEEDQQKELKKKAANQKNKDCKDGYIETWRKKFTYKGIDFELALLRYFNHELKFKPVTSSRICETHAVVEFLQGDEFLQKINKYLLEDEFLYHDTLHLWNDTQTRNEQLDIMYNRALEDITKIEPRLQEKIKKKSEEIQEIGALLMFAQQLAEAER